MCNITYLYTKQTKVSRIIAIDVALLDEGGSSGFVFSFLFLGFARNWKISSEVMRLKVEVSKVTYHSFRGNFRCVG